MLFTNLAYFNFNTKNKQTNKKMLGSHADLPQILPIGIDPETLIRELLLLLWGAIWFVKFANSQFRVSILFTLF